MKKVFRTHIILVIEGRLLTSLFVITGPLMTLYLLWCILEGDFGMALLVFITNVFYYWLSIFALRYLWQQCWGKLIITEKYIIWRALFCKPIKITYDELRYVKLESFKDGNVYKNRDYYKTGFLYILLSSNPLPKMRIDKIYSKNKLIKFPLYNKKLGNTLFTVLPAPYNQYFARYKKI